MGAVLRFQRSPCALFGLTPTVEPAAFSPIEKAQGDRQKSGLGGCSGLNRSHVCIQLKE
ncbi:hypothetical protein EMIT0324P_20801 [Pseudomonas chlororaphis]